MVLAYRSRPAANRAVTPQLKIVRQAGQGGTPAAGIAWLVVAVLNLTTGRMLAAHVTGHGPAGAIRVGNQFTVIADGPGADRWHPGGGRCG